MAALTTIGLNSGLDIGNLVSQLVAAEAVPAEQQFLRQETRLSAELSALGTLKSALASFQSSLEGLNEASDFGLLTTLSSRDDLFTATASAGAVAGQYAVEVLQTAQYHKLASATLTADTPVGGTSGDQLTLTVDGQSMIIDLSQGKTLANIRDAVNDSAENPGLTATLINVTETEQALVLTSKETGYVKRVEATETIASGGGTLALATANLDASGTLLADLADLDASVLIDGLQITRSANEIADAIDGVNISLHQAEPGIQALLRVDPDRQAVTSAIADFVENYNTLVRTLDTVSGYRGEGAPQPALFGDSMTRTIGNRLRSELGQVLANLGGTFSSLAEIGIDTNIDGTLVLDRTKLGEALSQDLEGVGQLFFSERGFATRIDGVLESFVASGGVLEARTDGIKDRLEDIDDQRVSLDRRLVLLEQRYLREFNAMDAMVGQLLVTSNFLTQQLANLPGPLKPKDSDS